MHEPVLLAEGAFEVLSSPEEAFAKDGFIIAPFQEDADNPYLFYSPKAVYSGWEPDVQISRHSVTPNETVSPGKNPCIVDYQSYATQAQKVINKLKAGDLEKAVLSRVIAEQLDQTFDPGNTFSELCLKYKYAFVYIFNDGNGRCWMGASPEMLLRTNNNKGKTVSLAATQPAAHADVFAYSWSEKDIKEQELVSGYISEILPRNGAENISEGEIETKIAGPVAHLCKRFDFEMPPEVNPLRLAMALHPTPAVCGLPVEEARNLILSTEQHKRAYYSGFIGPVSNSGNTDLFVNLRCMQLSGTTAYIYVGGGLLAGSVISDEWAETVKKAETLLCMLQK